MDKQAASITRPKFTEQERVQIPALRALMKMGYAYLPPADANKKREQIAGGVVLEDILLEQLYLINDVGTDPKKGCTKEDVNRAIEKLRGTIAEKRGGNVLAVNQAVTDLLLLGTSVTRPAGVQPQSQNVRFIDWRNWEKNAFHATAEYSLPTHRAEAGRGTRRPDIVLFVNGMPFVVLECKNKHGDLDNGIQQLQNYQKPEEIPQLFYYAQILICIADHLVKYATVGSEKGFWCKWKGDSAKDRDFNNIGEKRLTKEEKDLLFQDPFENQRSYFERMDANNKTADWTLWELCRPARLLELVHRFIVFEEKQGRLEKKVARTHQYELVRNALVRVSERDEYGRRRGGVVWHTQGSGKSLTMVMLAHHLKKDKEMRNARIVMVTDRKDLDKQIKGTFKSCGLEPVQATSARNLMQLIKGGEQVITTLVHKFDKARKGTQYRNPSKDIFVFVDEGHRTQYSELTASMAEFLPNACYIAFTGTPLLKKEKNTMVRFGPFIEPVYRMREALNDEVIVPLYYEGRKVNIHNKDKQQMDANVDRETEGMAPEKSERLKARYASVTEIISAPDVQRCIAENLVKDFTGSMDPPFKGQLVLPKKISALRFKQILDALDAKVAETERLNAKVIISTVGEHESHTEFTDEEKQLFAGFTRMVDQEGGESNYDKKFIEDFKQKDGKTRLLIVVDKLLTGFDAPLNKVLYLCKHLTDHALLQAIARVNRVYERKLNGRIVDYLGLLGNLQQSLSMYDELKGYEEQDLEGIVHSAEDQIEKIPAALEKLNSLFSGIKKDDQEAYETSLANEERRQEFYKAYAELARLVDIVLPIGYFGDEKHDAIRKECKKALEFYDRVRRFAHERFDTSAVDKALEANIRGILHRYVRASDVVADGNAMYLQEVNRGEPARDIESKNTDIAGRSELVDEGDGETKIPRVLVGGEVDINKVIAGEGKYAGRSPKSRAEILLNQAVSTIRAKRHEDPILYDKFSKMVDETIHRYQHGELFTPGDFNHTCRMVKDIENRKYLHVPAALEKAGNYKEVMPYYHIIAERVGKKLNNNEGLMSEVAMRIRSIASKHNRIGFAGSRDIQNKMQKEILEYFVKEVWKGEQISEELLKKIDDLMLDVIELVAENPN